MKNTLFLFIFFIFISCDKRGKRENDEVKPKLEVLLVGTFHFRNFDPKKILDVAQTKEVDVLSLENQKELELIKEKISEFNPSKIFVEFPAKDQKELDSIYKSFSNLNYNKVERKEIEQLAFRVGKNLKLNRIYACDFSNYKFPYE